MGIISFAQVEALPDPLLGDNFNFILGTVPLAGSTSPLIIKCADAIIPGFSNETQEMQVSGQVRKVRGRKMYPRTMSISFYEDITMNTLSILRNWHEAIVGSDSGTSIGNVADYSVLAMLQVFDQKNALVDQIEFVNCFINDVTDVSLSSESSQLVKVSAVFNYDRAEYLNTIRR
jgi:hypothetical protein